MADELSNLSPAPGSQRPRTRIGRGHGSGLVKTAGRGTKGQGARGSVRRGFEGGQMPLHRRLPKRGFINIFKKDYALVRLDRVAAAFAAGDVVDVEALVGRGLLSRVGKNGVKLLGNGEISIAITVRVDKVTASAAEKVKAAGGTVEGQVE
jgi:large subunit ribosomal protein L15